MKFRAVPEAERVVIRDASYSRATRLPDYFLPFKDVELCSLSLLSFISTHKAFSHPFPPSGRNFSNVSHSFNDDLYVLGSNDDQ